MELCDIGIQLPTDCVEEICQPGRNDEAVKRWVDKFKYPSKLQCIVVLHETGGWTLDELESNDVMELREKVLWCAAWNVFER